jgi:hypothetical protein
MMSDQADRRATRPVVWFGVGEEYRMLPFKGLYWYGS